MPSVYETDASVVAAAMEAMVSVGNAAVALEFIAAEQPEATSRALRCFVAGLQATRLRLRSALQTAGLLALLVVALLWPTAARAESWRAPDSFDLGALAAAEALITCDGLQTVQMSHHYDRGFSEMNPLLGTEPSRPRIVTSVAGAALLTAVAWYALPPKLRLVFTSVVVGAEGLEVWHNAQNGFGPFSTSAPPRAPAASFSIGFRVRL